MNWLEFEQQFAIEAAKRGLEQRRVASLLAYAEPLIRAELPVIFDLDHLSALLGLEPKPFTDMLNNFERMYFTFKIVKRSGGYRTIDQPVASLSNMQRWILRTILDKRSVHPAAMAFCRGRSIVDNAKLHIRRRKVLALDLHDFFGSVRGDVVRSLFLSFGYSTEVSAALTRLTCYFDRLPQGAATSPALSNLVFAPIDESFTRLAEQSSISYSRYADDLCFSGNFRVGRHIDTVRRTLAKSGFRLNESKTRLMLPHQRQEVTGLVVNERVRVPRSVRRQLRQESYFIQKHGVTAHEERVGSLLRNRTDYLRGLAEFVRSVDSGDRSSQSMISLLGRIKF